MIPDPTSLIPDPTYLVTTLLLTWLKIMGMFPKLLYQTYTLSRKIINLSWASFFYVGSCNSSVSYKLEIRITCRVTFKQIWHNISNVYLRTLHLGVQSDSSDDWHKNFLCWKVRKSFQSCSALTLRMLFPLSYSSLSGKTTVWLLHMNNQFLYFTIQPQTIGGSWEKAFLEN